MMIHRITRIEKFELNLPIGKNLNWRKAWLDTLWMS